MRAEERKLRLLRMQDYCEDALQALDFERMVHSTPDIQNLHTQWRLAQGAVSDLLTTFAADPAQDLSRLTHCVLWFMTVHAEPLQEVKHRAMPALPEQAAPAFEDAAAIQNVPSAQRRNDMPSTQQRNVVLSRAQRHQRVYLALQSLRPTDASRSTRFDRHALRTTINRSASLHTTLRQQREEATRLVQKARQIRTTAVEQQAQRRAARN